MSRRRKPTLNIEDAHIMWPNFSGEAGRYNREGDRNFCVFLDSDVGVELENEGWNIKWLEPREEGDEPQAYMQVSVNYNNIPPRIFMITGQGKTLLNENTVGMLDWADIKTADLIINPYEWEVNGKSGIKAYVKSLYVVIEEDEFASKYYDEPENPASDISEGLISIDSDHEF